MSLTHLCVAVFPALPQRNCLIICIINNSKKFEHNLLTSFVQVRKLGNGLPDTTPGVLYAQSFALGIIALIIYFFS